MVVVCWNIKKLPVALIKPIKYFNLAGTSYLGSTAHQLLGAELGPPNSIPRDGEIQRILSVRGTSSNVPSTS